MADLHLLNSFRSYQVISHHINITMSEVAKPTEATPAPAAIGGADSAPLPSTTPAAAATEPTPTTTDTITSASETAPTAPKEETVEQGEAKVEATPASEAILGYKGPGLIQ